MSNNLSWENVSVEHGTLVECRDACAMELLRHFWATKMNNGAEVMQQQAFTLLTTSDTLSDRMSASYHQHEDGDSEQADFSSSQERGRRGTAVTAVDSAWLATRAPQLSGGAVFVTGLEATEQLSGSLDDVLNPLRRRRPPMGHAANAIDSEDEMDLDEDDD